MRAAIIVDNKVFNIVEVASLVNSAWTLIASDTAQIGDTWNGAVFTKPTPVVVVPQILSRAQAKLALLQSGLLASVQPAIDGIADPTERMAAQIEWDDRGTFERDNGVLVAMASMLGMTDPQIDALFILGATL